MRSTIFISYRRADTREIASHIFDRLATRYGKRNVFLDVNTIGQGNNFKADIQRSIARTAVMLVIIGPEWLIRNESNGEFRIKEESDLVRQEISAAIEQGVHIIPVLVRDAKMPRAEDLPEDLQLFHDANAHVLSKEHQYLEDGFRKLAKAIDAHLPLYRRPRVRQIGAVITAMAFLVVLILAGIFGLPRGLSSPLITGTSTPTVPSATTASAAPSITPTLISSPSPAVTVTSPVTGPTASSPTSTSSSNSQRRTVEYPVSNNTYGIAGGQDRRVWFTELGGIIGAITSDGLISEYPVPPQGSPYGSSPWGIVSGPDGALWFTDAEALAGPSAIGRSDTSGQIRRFSLDHSTSPRYITAGPDSALWFTVDNNIGRITVDGQITLYPLPNADSYPQGITKGPDGALWFTESTRIGRISIDGKITEFPVGNNIDASEITLGPDGALWFTEHENSSSTGSFACGIGRISTLGQIKVFPLSNDTMPQGITTGPDGALWFTESNPKGIGHITIDGQVSTVFQSRNGTPSSITRGPDGAIWFTDGDHIGRIS